MTPKEEKMLRERARLLYSEKDKIKIFIDELMKFYFYDLNKTILLTKNDYKVE